MLSISSSPRRKVFIVRDEEEPNAFEEETKGDSKTKRNSVDETALHVQQVWKSPLLFYRTNHPLAANRSFKGPIHIKMPGGQVHLGMPTKNNAMLENEAERRRIQDNLLIFSSPGEVQGSRSNIFSCLLKWFLFPVDFILATLIFADPKVKIESSGSAFASPSLLSYVCTILCIMLGYMGLRNRSTRVITLFIVVFYVDALLNLIRVETVMQFSYFVVQLILCHLMGQFKLTLVPSWFNPP